MTRGEHAARIVVRLNVVATFLLLLVGGVVHATDSGLACPDWPQCFGSFFPPMVGKVFFEHGHRLFATGVGLLTIAQLALVWRGFPPGHASRSLAVGALLLVVWQGLLGGMTVRMRLPDAVSTAHLATSMLFFALLVVLAFRTRPATVDRPLPRSAARVTGVAAVAVYAQLVLGALVRHTDAGLACTRFPSCDGIGTSLPIALHMLHRAGAVIAAVAVIAAALVVLRAAGEARLARLLALAVPGLVVVQIFLGVMSVLSALEAVLVTAHLGVGALLWGTTVSMYCAARGRTA